LLDKSFFLDRIDRIFRIKIEKEGMVLSWAILLGIADSKNPIVA
jgi:hypothetical protein